MARVRFSVSWTAGVGAVVAVVLAGALAAPPDFAVTAGPVDKVRLSVGSVPHAAAISRWRFADAEAMLSHPVSLQPASTLEVSAAKLVATGASAGIGADDDVGAPEMRPDARVPSSGVDGGVATGLGHVGWGILNRAASSVLRKGRPLAPDGSRNNRPTETITDVRNFDMETFDRHINQHVDMARAMRVRFDGRGDTMALVSTIVFSLTCSSFALCVCAALNAKRPELFQQRASHRRVHAASAADVAATAPVHSGATPGNVEETSTTNAAGAMSSLNAGPGEAREGDAPTLSTAMPPRLPFSSMVRKALMLRVDDVIKTTSMDAALHLRFQELCLKIILSLMLVPLVVCPLHWSAVGGGDFVTRLGLAVDEGREHAFWVHDCAVWFVVLTTTRHLFRAQKEFLEMRQGWLRDLPRPQATTVLVDGIPEAFRSDRRLHEYFAGLFSEEAVERAYVVRSTQRLKWKLKARGRVASALREMEAAVGGVRTDQVELMQERVSDLDREIDVERRRLTRAASIFDPDVCMDAGLVTFRTRSGMHMALNTQLASNAHVFRLHPAPAQSDFSYDSVMVRRQFPHSTIIGWACIAGIFVAFVPLVVLATSLVTLDSLKAIVPLLRKVSHMPVTNAMLQGVLATSVLNMLMTIMPSVFMLVIVSFFRPISPPVAQVWLQQIYFYFLMVFVLLVTAMSHGLITTLVFVATHPTAVLPLLAKSLPLASHFYLGYLVLGWLKCAVELLRPSTFVQFLGIRMRTVVFLGQRVAWSTMMMVITLVFCSLLPVILVFASVYFVVERLCHGCMIHFMEPRLGDLGGVFWVRALEHLQVGLFVYVLLMMGVLGARGALHFFFLAPTLLYLVFSWRRFHNTFLWESLPLADLLALDAKEREAPRVMMQSVSPGGEEEDGVAAEYQQAECHGLESVLPEASESRPASSDVAASRDHAEAATAGPPQGRPAVGTTGGT